MFNNVLSLTYYSIIGIGYIGNILVKPCKCPIKKQHVTSNIPGLFRDLHQDTVTDPGISIPGGAVPAR